MQWRDGSQPPTPPRPPGTEQQQPQGPSPARVVGNFKIKAVRNVTREQAAKGVVRRLTLRALSHGVTVPMFNDLWLQIQVRVVMDLRQCIVTYRGLLLMYFTFN